MNNNYSEYTVCVGNDPVCYGECTDAEAIQIADKLQSMIESEFPGIQVRRTNETGVPTPTRGPDEATFVTRFINGLSKTGRLHSERLNIMKNPAAVALGRLGGAANTPAQQAARKENSKKGGWPKGRKRKPKNKGNCGL